MVKTVSNKRTEYKCLIFAVMFFEFFIFDHCHKVFENLKKSDGNVSFP